MGRASKRKQDARAAAGSTRALLERLAPAVRSEVLGVYRPDSCIATTNVLLRALRVLGLDAEPIPVRCAVFNRAFALRTAQEGHAPQSEGEREDWKRESGAYSVGIGYEPPDGFRAGDARLHLVAVVQDTWLVDASLDQAARPQHDIHLAPGVFTLDRRWFARGVLTVQVGQPSSFLRYERISAGYWQGSPDWTDPLNARLAAAALQRCGWEGDR